jgi:hypothetical protein
MSDSAYRNQLRLKLRDEFNLRIVTDTYVDIVEFLMRNPGAKPAIIAKNVDQSDNTTFKAIKKLKELNVLSEDNRVNLKVDKTASAFYPLPSNIREKEMPPRQYKYVHQVAFLASLKDFEQVKSTGLTVGTYLERLQRQIVKDNESLVKNMYELQNLLALASLLSGNLDNWKDMIGSINTEDIK